MKVIIKTNFSGLTDDELVTKTEVIVTDMTGNPNFTTPTPTTEVVDAKKTAFQTALIAAQDGGRSQTILKNKLRAELIALLQTLGYYVQLNCKDDPAIAGTSGYEWRQAGSPHGILDAPEYVKIDFGPIPGSIKITTNKIKGARVYVIQWALGPVTESTHWEEDISTAKTFLIKGLTPGKEYAFRVAGKGASTTLVFSEIIMHMVG